MTERAEGIEAIQRDIAEIANVMREINTLVVEQGDLVDNIQNNITSTAERTTEGTTELMSASNYQRSARTKMCWILLICFVILAIIIVVVVLKLT